MGAKDNKALVVTRAAAVLATANLLAAAAALPLSSVVAARA